MAIRVFFAPTSNRIFVERSLMRLLTAKRAVPKEDLFVLLWHLGSYSWAGNGGDHDDEIRNEWLNLASELGKVSRARFLVLMPEQPQDLSRDPHANFVFPDLLAKSILRDHVSEKHDCPSILCTTYAKLAEQLASDPLSTLIQWQGANFDDSMLIRYCGSMAALPLEMNTLCPKEKARITDPKAAWIKHDDLFRFFHNRIGYRAEELHGSGPDKSEEDQGLTSDERFWARKVSVLEHILSRAFLSPRLPLNILVVENNFKDLQAWNDMSIERHQVLWTAPGNSAQAIASCLGYLTNQDAKIFVIGDASSGECRKEDFKKLRSSEERKNIQADLYTPNSNGGLDTGGQRMPVPWDRIDLVLQDVMLDKSGKALTG